MACLLNLLGADWSSKSFHDKQSSIMTILGKVQAEDEALFRQTPALTKWWLMRATDIYGHNLLHRSARHGMHDCISGILKEVCIVH